MKSKVALAAVCGMVALVGLGGCNRTDAGGRLALTGAKYCTPFKTTAANAASGNGLGAALSDPAGAFEDCVHRWGYTLAPARDPADVVAQATLDACGPILTAWNQQTMNQAPQGQTAQGAPPQGEDQQAAQANNPVAQRMRMAEARALFYVVQARSAGCAPPPANTLLTTTTPAS